MKLRVSARVAGRPCSADAARCRRRISLGELRLARLHRMPSGPVGGELGHGVEGLGLQAAEQRAVSRSVSQRSPAALDLPRLLVADGDRLGSEPPGQRADGVRALLPASPAVVPPAIARRSPPPPCPGGSRDWRSCLGLSETQELVGRHAQRLAHLVNEREARLDLGALVARVAVLLDARATWRNSARGRTRAGCAWSSGVSRTANALRARDLGHCTRGFADCAQKVIVENCILLMSQIKR